MRHSPPSTASRGTIRHHPKRSLNVVLRTLPLVVVALSVAWVCYRYIVLRAAATEILEKAKELQLDVERHSGHLVAFEAGFLNRSAEDFAGDFLRGVQWDSNLSATALSWSGIRDGLYLVVDINCRWSQEAVEDALARREYDVILLDPVLRNGPRWRQEYTMSDQDALVITPDGGWWRNGVPYGVTPVGFVVERGTFAAVGVGLDGVRMLQDRDMDSRTPSRILGDDSASTPANFQ